MSQKGFSQTGFAHLVLISMMLITLVTISGVGVYVSKAQTKKTKNQEIALQKQQQLTKQTADAKAAQQAQLDNQKKAADTAKSSAPVATPAAPSKCAPDTTMYVTTASGLYVRTGASFNASTVILMPYAASVQVGCLADGWYHVSYAGKSGFASQSYLSASKPKTDTATGSPGSPAASSPSPAPAPSAPSTVTIGNYTYKCLPGANDPHWQNLIYATLNPTYSHSSPNGPQLNSYPQWSNITGLSCATTNGWLTRNGEYFLGTDLVVS
jgi:uncharacterized protein YraI